MVVPVAILLVALVAHLMQKEEEGHDVGACLLVMGGGLPSYVQELIFSLAILSRNKTTNIANFTS